MKSATVVTALYNIGRDNLSGQHAHRSFTKYLNWFKHLLSLNAPMVIFIPQELHAYIREHRPAEYATKVVIRQFEELDAYEYHDRIQATIDSMVKEPNKNGGIPRYFSECPEFITAKYETIIYSKFDFLKEVADENPHNTDYFIWLDAGTFYDPLPFDCKLPWPDPYKIQLLQDKFLLANLAFNPNDKSPLDDKRNYLRQHRNEICAYILGGSKVAIDNVYDNFWNQVDDALNMGVINNEQHILQLLALERPEDYHIWYRTQYQYFKLPIPLRERMIPVELAVGTDMREQYGIENRVKLLTLATREIASTAFRAWETTARHYGYNYEIIGRNDSWKGFGTKIRAFYNRLQNVTEPYTILTDCTDLFFCGSAVEAYDKFTKLDSEVIVGGEMIAHYPGNTHDKKELQSFFEEIRESAQAFPNSGFIMGKTQALKELMELHLNYKDDQVPCFDTIYEDKYPLDIDYQTQLIGNVPNYKQSIERAINYFEFDDKMGRYRNAHSKEYPVAFHFPGSNWGAMQMFYTRGLPLVVIQSTDDDSSSSSAGWVFVIILVIVALLTLALYYGFH